MIRRYGQADCDAVLGVWAAASAQAHPFLEPDFLVEESEAIRTIHLPRTETWVWEAESRVVGFVSMVGNEVGALFVMPACQRSGIGRSLMDHVRALHGALEVEVFRDNHAGRRFYDGYGFVRTGESTHPPTGLPLLRLRLPDPE